MYGIYLCVVTREICNIICVGLLHEPILVPVQIRLGLSSRVVCSDPRKRKGVANIILSIS